MKKSSPGDCEPFENVKPARTGPRLPKRPIHASHDCSKKSRSNPINLPPRDYKDSIMSKRSGTHSTSNNNSAISRHSRGHRNLNSDNQFHDSF